MDGLRQWQERLADASENGLDGQTREAIYGSGTSYSKKVLEIFPGATVTDVITPIDNEMPSSSTPLAETDLIENPEPNIFP